MIDIELASFNLKCSCYVEDHTIRFSSYSYEREELSLSAEILLRNWKPIWRRCVIAFKYVFRIGNMDTHFDSTLIEKSEAIKLRDFLNDYIQDPRAV